MATNLKNAHNELFRRTPDESFDTLDELLARCQQQKEESLDRWQMPQSMELSTNGSVAVGLEDDGTFTMNDWSFSQLCSLARVSKDTVNRLSPATAGQVLRETIPTSSKPIQILTEGKRIRSIHGTQYSRLWNEDLVRVAMETEFSPPQKAISGGTGLYAGEQDLFCFLIDPLGWVEIGEETFAPGLFIWNSEVGRRSLGIQTFWFQSICANHIVWDAIEVVEWKRRHTGDISGGLDKIREIVDNLVKRRDERKDGFVPAIRKAMRDRLGDDADECLNVLKRHGINRALAKRAVEYAQTHGGFSIWCIVDALTRIAGEEIQFAGLRMEADQKSSQLLQLAL